MNRVGIDGSDTIDVRSDATGDESDTLGDGSDTLGDEFGYVRY